MGFIRRCLPRPWWNTAFAVLRFARQIVYFGWSRYCPVCRSRVRSFKPHGIEDRPDARCPVCGAVERYRLLWLFLDRRPELFGGAKKMLHFAPEQAFERRFRKIEGLEYLSADLDPSRAMVAMDITNIPCGDETFDIVCCVHVLEHVPDDRKAMREVCRVLRKGGRAIIQVPITAEKSFEDATITDPAARERVYGLDDHLRRYGLDVEERLREAGFTVTRYGGADVADTNDIKRMALKDEPLFLCTKPAD